MSDHEPRRAGALEDLFHPGTHGAASGPEAIELHARRDLVLLLLRGRTAQASWRERCEAALGLALPLTPNTTAMQVALSVLWLGPDEWLISGRPAEHSVGALMHASPALVDISHGRTVIRLAGRRAPELLAKGLPIDLHPRAFGPGRCAQSVMARCNVLLHQLDERPSFDLYVPRSYARSLARFLLEAGAEFGYRVLEDA